MFLWGVGAMQVRWKKRGYMELDACLLQQRMDCKKRHHFMSVCGEAAHTHKSLFLNFQIVA
jgi:hypothetical protein